MVRKKTNLIIAQIVVTVIVMRNKIGIVNTARYCFDNTSSCHRPYVHNILLVVCLQVKIKKKLYVKNSETSIFQFGILWVIRNAYSKSVNKNTVILYWAVLIPQLRWSFYQWLILYTLCLSVINFHWCDRFLTIFISGYARKSP